MNRYLVNILSRHIAALLLTISAGPALAGEGQPGKGAEASTLEDRILKGMGEYHSRCYCEAIQTLEKVVAELEADPNHSETVKAGVLVTLGLSYQKAQYSGKAFEQFRKAVEIDPLQEQAMDCLWNLTEGLGEQAVFLRLTSRMLENHPSGGKSPVLWAYYGRALSQQKQYSQALEAFHESLALDPNSSRTYAFLYEGLRPICEAEPNILIDIFTKLRQRYPEAVHPCEYLWREYTRRAEEDKKIPESCIMFLEKALEAYDVVARSEQDSPNTHFQLAEIYYQLAEAHVQVNDHAGLAPTFLDKSIKEYRTTLQYLQPVSSETATVCFNLGKACVKRNLCQEAIDYLQRAEQINMKIGTKKQPAYYFYLGRAYHRKSEDDNQRESGDADKAEYYFRQFLEVSGLADSETYSYLGDIYIQKHNYGESVRAFRMALQASEVYGTSDEDYRYRLGYALLRSGQSEESIVELTKAIGTKANQAQVHLELARAYHEIGQIRKARKHIQEAQALDSSAGARSDVQRTARSIRLTLLTNLLLKVGAPSILGIVVFTLVGWRLYHDFLYTSFGSMRFRKGSPQETTFRAARDLELNLRKLVLHVARSHYGDEWEHTLEKELKSRDPSMIEECRRIMNQRSWQGGTFLDATYFSQLIKLVVAWKWEDWFEVVFNKARGEVGKDFERINEYRNRAAHHYPISPEDANLIRAMVDSYMPDIDAQLKPV
jgi:tetratricopeptide (TPR) repeat protein